MKGHDRKTESKPSGKAYQQKAAWCFKIALGTQISVVVCCLAQNTEHIKHNFSSYWGKHCSGTLKVTLSTMLPKALDTQQAWIQIECRMLRPLQNQEQLQSLRLFKMRLWYSQKYSHFKQINIPLPSIVLKLNQRLMRFWPHLATKPHNILFGFTCRCQVVPFKKINKLASSLKFLVCIKAMHSFTKKTAYNIRGHWTKSAQLKFYWVS